MISVAMCTYNGEKFLSEQLNSFAEQTVLPDELVIFDDASQDNTIDILTTFTEHAPFVVRIHRNSSSVGVIKNFALAIEACKGDYILLSDQDDVWLPDKIEVTLKKMLAVEEEHGKLCPVCVHTDLTVVDERLNVLANSFLTNQGLYHCYTKKEQLSVLPVQNFVTGCTVMLNRALKEKAMPFPKNIVMHDYWLALVAACVGRLEFVNMQTIKYRQHGKNTVGAKKYLSINSLLSIADYRVTLKKIKKNYYQLLELIKFKSGMCANKDMINFCKYIKDGNVNAAIKVGFRKEGIFRNFIYKIYLKRLIKEMGEH